MDNPEECSVCFTKYSDDERRPRTLPCGHNFCTSCISDMMEANQVSCPTCRATHQATNISDFHINFGIEELVKKVESLKQALITLTSPSTTTDTASVGSDVSISAATGISMKNQNPAISKKLHSMLDEQKKNVEVQLTDCQGVQSQLDQYRKELGDNKDEHLQQLHKLYVLVEHHKTSLELLEQEDTKVVAMKKEGEDGEQQLKAALKCLQSVNTAQEVVTAIYHADHYTVEVEDYVQKCREMFPDTFTITTSLKIRDDTRIALETLPAQDDAKVRATQDGAKQASAICPSISTLLKDPSLTIMDRVQHITKPDLKRKLVMKWLIKAGRLYGVQQDEGRLRSSKISAGEGKVYLHCLRDEPAPSHVHTQPVSELLQLVDSSSTLTFLDLAWGGSTRERVHIRLRPNNTFATQFLWLCMGQKGSSYLNTIMFHKCSDWVRGGDYQYNNGTGGASLVTHSQINYYTESVKTGIVASLNGPGNVKLNAQFFISTIDHGSTWNDVFGNIESGLDVVKAAVNHSNIKDVTVVDCGVVLPL